MPDAITEIRPLTEDDLDAVVDFSLRAWAPVYESLQRLLGDEIFLRLHPDWRADQEAVVRSICANPERDVFVAVANARPVGFVGLALNVHREGMGEIEIIAVDPDFQRRGIGERLTEFAFDHLRSRGMDIAVVETGGDPGHAPARALYEEVGFTLLPMARYFRSLNETLGHTTLCPLAVQDART